MTIWRNELTRNLCVPYDSTSISIATQILGVVVRDVNDNFNYMHTVLAIYFEWRLFSRMAVRD